MNTQAVTLYRALLRATREFPSYNYRTYALRRVRDVFRQNRTESDPTRIASLIKSAEDNLQIIRRQVTIGKLYSANKLVIETEGNLPSAPMRTAVTEERN